MVYLHHSSKIKVIEKLQNSRNQGFSYYFGLMVEGSGPGSGSVFVTNGSDADPGGPKKYGSYGSGSPTLKKSYGKRH
jgi:hypothetical protein